ncbi:MAG: EAL domain-containing protein, partial [Pseudomonadota bacterium]
MRSARLNEIARALFGRDPRRLWLRYIVAVTIILSLLIGAHVISKATVDAGRHDAEIVNVSGRQRMLSQRILLLADKFEETREPAVAARLAASIRLFDTSHRHLASLQDLPPEAQLIYFGAPGLDRRARAFIEDAQRVLTVPPGPEQAAALARLEEVGLDDLLATLNDAVTAFEIAAKRNSANIAFIQDAALYLALIILALEALVIFRPAQRIVTHALDDLEHRSAQLAHNAHHDALTGLANRAGLEERLRGLLGDGPGQDRVICVMHMDLDRFKEVNDTLGHAAGDAVLRHVAEALKTNARSGDVIARVGGDEFVLALPLPRASAETAARGIAEALIKAVRRPILFEGSQARVGASVGYAFADGPDAAPDRLIADADIALYEVKRAGRGAARAVGPEMRAGLERRRQVLDRLEAALDAGRLEAFLQPQVSLDDGRLLGFEALARWRRSDGAVASPAEFMGFAEEAGLMERVDRLVMDSAVAVFTGLRADGFAAPSLSLNVSARSLRSDGFADALEDRIRAAKLLPRDVSVEVLESFLIGDRSNRAAAAMAALSDRGFPVVIDDFGTGHASLASLAGVRISGLKIDRSLIAEFDDDRAGHVISAIAGLAKGLQLSVTAEGVETAEQFAALKRLGCDAAQGYAIGRPMDA